MAQINDLMAFVSVAQAGGFRDAARGSSVSPSSLSVAVRRLETRLGVRLLHRTTRSVAPTEAGQRLLDRLAPLLGEMDAALDVLNRFRDRPAGTLRLNVPANVMKSVLPAVLAPFLQRYPDIQVEVLVEDGFVDLLAAGCDAGIRYGERLAQDMIALPFGPKTQRFVTAATPAYWREHGKPEHPRDLLEHRCLRVQFAGGARADWEFERKGEVLRLDPPATVLARPAASLDLLIQSALLGIGVVHLFSELLQPHLDRGELESVLPEWEESFPGPFLYYPGHRHVPAPLQAFVGFVRELGA